ncbi:MAG TPA: L-threonine 3-dehydrogenase [Rhizomicrobium sp.]|jgi:threonine 3-dehydrogenase|nr:L-threonine 3-dehydrogenase [Rhizomicrobium sp.]
MFAILKARPEKGLSHADVETPAAPGPGEVEIAVSMAGVCGTDFHIWKWDEWSARRVKPPRVVGHEFVGRITKVGEGVDHLSPGQRVSCECHVTCGHCRLCRTGRAHLCQATSIIGVDRAGAFAERVVVPASNVWLVHDRIPDRHAAVFDPCGNAMHSATVVPLAGRDVLITGAGTIGLFSIGIARSHGARKVIVTEISEYRSEIARRLGADLVVDPRNANAREQIIGETDGQGPELVLEMSGNADALRSALEMAGNGAHVVLLGLPGSDVTLDLAETVIMKGATLHGVTGRRMFETWYDVSAFMLRNPELMDRVLTHRLAAQEYAEGFDLIAAGKCGKVILDFNKEAA